jgi:hypothetical protein
MSDRQQKAFARQQAAQDKYIQEVASSSKSPADEIARAKDLLDSGTITSEEYDSLKAKALA